MRVAKNVIRFLIVLMTSVWGLVFGILIPILLMGGTSETTLRNICILWIFMSVVGYFVPCFLTTLGFYKSAIVSSAVGTALTVYLHISISAFYTAAYMYLPQICMTVLTILCFLVANAAKNNEGIAPSILDDKGTN